MDWKEYVGDLSGLLLGMDATDSSGISIDAGKAFQKWCQDTIELRSAEGTVFFVGNGASASMASHFAADLCKNGRVRTQVFTDIALITACGNDLGYEHVFSEPLKQQMRKGDMLVAISSSGNSPNVVKAVEAAHELGGSVVTLSAMSQDNAIRQRGDLNCYVSASTYGLAETAHASILHFWMDCVSQY